MRSVDERLSQYCTSRFAASGSWREPTVTTFSMPNKLHVLPKIDKGISRLPTYGGLRYNRAPMDPRKLPIYALRADLTETLASGSRIIIEAPTGSGKSTQVPQMVLD